MVKSARRARGPSSSASRRSRGRACWREYDELLEAKREDQPGGGGRARLGASATTPSASSSAASTSTRRRCGRTSPTRSVRDGVLGDERGALRRRVPRATTRSSAGTPSVECYDVLERRRARRALLPRHAPARRASTSTRRCSTLRPGVARRRAARGRARVQLPRAAGTAIRRCSMHGQVTTFFHEFGHLLHHLFGGRSSATSRSRASPPSGTSSRRRSQMFEEWAWDAGVLQRFARHHETGEPIPAELVERMRDAEEYGKGLHVGTQMFYARALARLPRARSRGPRPRRADDRAQAAHDAGARTSPARTSRPPSATSTATRRSTTRTCGRW